jgi:DNA polymerase-3 subunit delta
MRLQLAQLSAYLQRALAPVCLIFGEEPLLMNEAADAVRAAARGRGHTERIVLTANGDFDWARLLHEGRNLSLFATRQIIELRMLSGKPGTAGSQALQRYCASAPDTNLLLITAPKLDAQAQKAEWFAALDRAGVVIQVKAVEARELPGWIAGRLRSHGFRPTREVMAALAERVEGNLLAAAQEIEKLKLLYGNGELGLDSVLDAVADSARFTVYHLADSVLRGESGRAVRILSGLRAEGVEPAIVLWALVRELRSLVSMVYDLKSGVPMEQVLAKHRVWEHRKPMVSHALKRHSLRRAQRLLQRAGTCDQIIKGIRQDSPWDALMQLSLALAGQDLSGPLSPEETPCVGSQ